MSKHFLAVLALSAAYAACTSGPAAAANAAPSSDCPKTKVLSVMEELWEGTGTRRMQDRYQIPGKNGFFFTSGMTIDADGSPHAFHPNSKKGLDDLEHAGASGNWWGIMTDSGDESGKPVVQGPNDPAPGYYISQTGLEDMTKEKRDPRRYVDAERVPYIVLSGTEAQNFSAKFGDYVAVYNKENGKVAYAMYGDDWPTLKIGEGSIALAKELGIDASARSGGAENPTVLYLVFPNSRAAAWTAEEPIEQTRAEAAKQFEAWGGLAQLKACAH